MYPISKYQSQVLLHLILVYLINKYLRHSLYQILNHNNQPRPQVPLFLVNQLHPNHHNKHPNLQVLLHLLLVYQISKYLRHLPLYQILIHNKYLSPQILLLLGSLVLQTHPNLQDLLHFMYLHNHLSLQVPLLPASLALQTHLTFNHNRHPSLLDPITLLLNLLPNQPTLLLLH